jgi:hypothetical protein
LVERAFATSGLFSVGDPMVYDDEARQKPVGTYIAICRDGLRETIDALAKVEDHFAQRAEAT